MKMKIGYRFGHLLISNVDTGAKGILDEGAFNRLYGSKVVAYLALDGNDMLNCTPNSAYTLSDSLNYGINKANENNVDLFISEHANCFNGEAHGSEAICGSQAGIDIGNRITANLEKLGFTNRHAYIDVRGLAEIRGTKMTCVIIEPLFVDSQIDVDLLNKIGIDTFAKAIAEGIVGHSISAPIPKAHTYRVRLSWNNSSSQKGAYSSLDNAIAFAKTLSGYKVFDENGNVIFDGAVVPVEQPKVEVVQLQSSPQSQNNSHDFKTLQGYIGAAQDNIPGPETLRKCPVINFGAKGNIVEWIQSRLNDLGFNCGAADGDFGNMTLNAIKAFQSKFGLGADGIIGQNTWRKLLEL